MTQGKGDKDHLSSDELKKYGPAIEKIYGKRCVKCKKKEADCDCEKKDNK